MYPVIMFLMFISEPLVPVSRKRESGGCWTTFYYLLKMQTNFISRDIYLF